MSRELHGDAEVDGIVVVGEIADSDQTTVPGPAAWPRAKTSRSPGPSRSKPETRPLRDKARRASSPLSPEIAWPTAGPVPAAAVTLRPACRAVITSHDWVAEVVTECAASANSWGSA